MQQLNIDIETYSGVDIKRAGAFQYALSPDFEILLFAYSADDGPVEVVDLRQGDTLPPDILRALFDPSVVKHAYNAAFEWWCLSRHFRLGQEYAMSPDAWLPQWRCTMLHGLYCGYTAGLGATGEALGLPQDRRKLSTGSALIRTFCVPCKPGKSNGGRTRTLPHHEPEKWELFKEYCRQDVVTEMEIGRRLSAFPVPDFVQKQWETDLTVNARGVAVDQELVDGALYCAQTVTEQLKQEAVSLTGLSNPNSVAQLTRWLETEIDEEVPTLRKADVSDLLGRDLPSDTARRMLEIRQELGKTSCKKFDAIKAAVGDDGRVRGLLQFYGANRTGRWAGRLVQVQNLPQTHLPVAAHPYRAGRVSRACIDRRGFFGDRSPGDCLAGGGGLGAGRVPDPRQNIRGLRIADVRRTDRGHTKGEPGIRPPAKRESSDSCPGVPGRCRRPGRYGRPADGALRR